MSQAADFISVRKADAAPAESTLTQCLVNLPRSAHCLSDSGTGDGAPKAVIGESSDDNSMAAGATAGRDGHAQASVKPCHFKMYEAHLLLPCQSATWRQKSYRDFNDIRVRSFILAGAPIKSGALRPHVLT